MKHSFSLLRFSLILLVINAWNANFVSAGEITQEAECRTVGYVIESYDSGISAFSKLCENGQIRIGSRLKVQILCYGQSEYQWVKEGTHLINRLCNYNRDVESVCWLVSCTRSERKLALLHPRASTIRNTPDLEWSVVEGAKNYEVLISSHGEPSFQVKTEGTTLKLSNQYSLMPGNIYRLDIYASNETEILQQSRFSLRVPTQAETKELEALIRRVEATSIQEDDKVRIIDAAYMRIGLIYESIAFLRAMNPSILTASLLADRYAELGYSGEAKENYKIVISNTSNTSENHIFATKMLARIDALHH